MRRTNQHRPAALNIRACTDEILRHAARAGIEGDTAIGRAFRMTRQGIWSVMTGATMPSTKFIAGALRALPTARFEDLFEVVETRSPDVSE